MTVTADTITDEMIIALRDEAPIGRTGRQIREWCDIALGRFALSTQKAVRAARARLAEIINARAKETS